MTALILGPNASGKSAYAERLVSRLSTGAPYYIATMLPHGEDGLARVERHRRQREPMGFITVERPFLVSGTPVSPDAAVLLEDVSNLLGNAMFTAARGGSENSVFEDIAALCASCRDAVLVSIGGLEARPEYDDETRGYIDALNRLNSRLAELADMVVAMSGGTPILMKGEAYALD